MVKSSLPSLGLVIAMSALAQQPAEAPVPLSFEVASIRVKNAGMVEGGCLPASFFSGETLTARNCPLGSLILFAYDIYQQQLSMGSSLALLAAKYDITAKAERPVSRAQMKQMLRSLLEERFKLKLRHETREVPVYALVVGKDGPKFQQTHGDADGGPKVTMEKPGQPVMQNASMSDLLTSLSGRVQDRVIIDKTGLKERYDLEMGWYLALRDPDAPSIFTAVQTLGLKLEPQKSAVEFLIIDHVEKPSEN